MDPDPARSALVAATLQAHGLAAFLFWRPEEVVMATGVYPYLGQTLCLYPVDDEPVLFVPTVESTPDAGFTAVDYTLGSGAGPAAWSDLRSALARELDRRAPRGGPVGCSLGGFRHAPAGSPAETPAMAEEVVQYLLGPRLQEAGAQVAELCLTKTAAEVAAIRRTQAVAGAGLAAFQALLQPGRSEAEIAGQVEAAVQAATGSRGVAFARGWAFVQAGPNSARAGQVSRSSGYRLAAGDLAVLELATCVDGYWSDLTRTAAAGRPSPQAQALLDAVQAAQAAAIAAIRPGVPHAAIDAAARAVLDRAGYGAGFTHATGHHVGFRYHDAGPMLAPGSEALLAAGMVITVEPGAYGRDFGGGARIEDNVLVTETGAEVLSEVCR